MFRLDNYMEKWAEAYLPLSHKKEDPAFFRMNDIFTVDEFLNHYNRLNKPVCGIVTHIKSRVNAVKRMNMPTYECVFLARADARDYKAQADAKESCWELMWAFLLRLDHDRQEAARVDRGSALANLDLTDMSAETLGPITNGWFMLVLTIDAQQKESRCYSDSDYDPDKLSAWKPFE